MKHDNTKLGNKDSNIMYEAFVKQAKVDGVDHICIGKSATTMMGRYAYIDKKKSFFIPNLGSFTSVNTFLSWMFTGNEDFRHKECYLGRYISNNNDLYKRASYYAKYHQLTAVTSFLIKNKEALTLPWIEYTVFTTGIKEYSRNKHRAGVIKAMIEHIVSRSTVPFSCRDFDYEKDSKTVIEYIKNKFNVESSSVDGEKEIKPKKKFHKKSFNREGDKKPLETLNSDSDTNTQVEEDIVLNEQLDPVKDTFNETGSSSTLDPIKDASNEVETSSEKDDLLN